MKISTIVPAHVDTIPDQLEDGVLYVCEQYKTVVHKCCCGCGEEVVTPLSPAEWSLRKTGDAVSLKPSIGNWSYGCKSHYWITRNRVVWAGSMSPREIDFVKARDKADKKAYVETVNRQKSRQAWPIYMATKLWNALVVWWR